MFRKEFITRVLIHAKLFLCILVTDVQSNIKILCAKCFITDVYSESVSRRLQTKMIDNEIFHMLQKTL
jgi:hypothetical protein